MRNARINSFGLKYEKQHGKMNLAYYFLVATLKSTSYL